MCPLPQRTDAEQRDRLFSTHWDDPALAGWSDALYTIAGYVLALHHEFNLSDLAGSPADDVFAVPSGFHIRLPAWFKLYNWNVCHSKATARNGSGRK